MSSISAWVGWKVKAVALEYTHPPTHPYLWVYCLAQVPGMDLAAVRQVLPGCCPVLIHAVEKKGSVLQECRVLRVGFGPFGKALQKSWSSKPLTNSVASLSHEMRMAIQNISGPNEHIFLT